MGPAFALQAGHLKPTDTAFFAHWHQLLDLEEGSSSSRRADLWRLPGDQPSPAHASADSDTQNAQLAVVSNLSPHAVSVVSPQWL